MGVGRSVTMISANPMAYFLKFVVDFILEINRGRKTFLDKGIP